MPPVGQIRNEPEPNFVIPQLIVILLAGLITKFSATDSPLVFVGIEESIFGCVQKIRFWFDKNFPFVALYTQTSSIPMHATFAFQKKPQQCLQMNLKNQGNAAKCARLVLRPSHSPCVTLAQRVSMWLESAVYGSPLREDDSSFPLCEDDNNRN